MLIVEENKKFTEFFAVSPYHECVVYITEPNFWFFEYFSEGLFLKMLYEDVIAITGKIEESITAPEVCS